MATNTAGSVRRKYYTQQTHYAAFALTYADAGIASGVAKQTLPAGAVIVRSWARLSAAFNAQTTNVVTVGVNGTTANDIIASGDINEASAQIFSNISPTVSMPLAADSVIWAKYTQTGTAATTGAAIIVIEYIPSVS